MATTSTNHSQGSETCQRAICRFCGSARQRTFLDLGKSPLCESFLTYEQLDEAEAFYPLHVYVCEECLLVQLREYVTGEEIFSDYAYFSSYSDSWLRHAEQYTERISKRFGLGKDNMVIELASNDGYLLQYFVQRGIPCLGIEPAENVAVAARERNVPTRVLYFGESVAVDLREEGVQADLLIANNVLAHVPRLNDFVAGMKRILAPNGVVTVEFPHLLRLVERNQFDTIYHEHFCYFSLMTVRKLFAAHGLQLFDVEELSTHGGSLRCYVQHEDGGPHALQVTVAAIERLERLAGFDQLAGYERFAEEVHKAKRDILRFLISAKDDQKQVVGYGAPGKGNTLLNYCGVRSDFVDYTVDRNPRKQGKFLPGTHIPIHSPDRIKETCPDYVLLLPWNLKDELVDQLDFVFGWGGKLVVPIPNVQIISGVLAVT